MEWASRKRLVSEMTIVSPSSSPLIISTSVMLVALVFILTNFVVDILYAWLDPRIRYG